MEWRKAEKNGGNWSGGNDGLLAKVSKELGIDDKESKKEAFIKNGMIHREFVRRDKRRRFKTRKLQSKETLVLK